MLSEVVANAWDADAERVTIDIDKEKGEIVVYDTGDGMDQYDINARYQGTKIVLKDLKKRLSRTAEYLRRRLARRFSVIGRGHDFEVVLDGAPITAKDRGYYDKIEFLWHLENLERIVSAVREEAAGVLLADRSKRPTGDPK